jgi:hypothetical protein
VKLPEAVQRLFHRYHADRLDTERHADVVLATVLAYGSLDDWDWLFQTYGWPRVRAWIAAPGRAQALPPPMERFWTMILLGAPQETPLRSGNALRRVPPEALPAWWPPELR